VSQEESEHNEVDGMKNGVDFTGEMMHVYFPFWCIMLLVYFYGGCRNRQLKKLCRRLL